MCPSWASPESAPTSPTCPACSPPAARRSPSSFPYMPREFALPDLGEGLTEAEIVAVLVREGEVIGEDAPLLEVETDKAQVEIPSPIGGRVEKIHVRPGQTVKVGAVLVTFADNGAPATATAAPPRTVPVPTAPTAPTPVRESAPAGGPVAATPATRRLARELGVDLRT